VGDGQLRLKVAVAAGLATAAVVVALAIGWGMRQSELGCQRYATDNGLELVSHTWYGKGDDCTTRAPDGTLEQSHHGSWASPVLGVVSIPVGIVLGAGAFLLVVPRKSP
jgi:hypothetical protein